MLIFLQFQKKVLNLIIIYPFVLGQVELKKKNNPTSVVNSKRGGRVILVCFWTNWYIHT